MTKEKSLTIVDRISGAFGDLQERMGKRYLEKRYSLPDLDKHMDSLIIGQPTAAGVNVSESSALNYAPIFTCVRILSETVAKVPFEFYERLPRGKRKATDHPLYAIIHDNANPEMSSYQFRETLQGHLCTWGNAYAEIQYNPDGNIEALWPLRPDRMVDIKRIDGNLWYQYRLPGQFGKDAMLPAYRVLHISFMGFNGVSGYSPISLARDSIALGMAQQEYAARLFKNGARPGGILNIPEKVSMNLDTKKLFKESFEEIHGGLSNQHRVGILEDGITFQEVGFPPETTQFLESRNFTAREMAAWFGIPAHKVGAKTESGTYANVEAQGIDFVSDILPWYRRWETTYSLKLLGTEERRLYFAEFNLNGLMRGDSAARAAYQTAMFNIGKYSINELRDIDNENPVEDENADKHWIALNMAPIGERPPVKLQESPPAATPTRSNNEAVSQSLKPIFREAVREIAERESKDVERARKRPDFSTWLKDYYNTLPETIERRMGALVEALAIARPEIGAMEILGHLRACARDYAATNRGVLESGGQIDTAKAIEMLANRCQDLPEVK
ncbi:MAG: phage portal protein [Methylococcaceae bacterium]|nr:phage portal protein [Methylococcaceae bacterium]